MQAAVAAAVVVTMRFVRVAAAQSAARRLVAFACRLFQLMRKSWKSRACWECWDKGGRQIAACALSC